VGKLVPSQVGKFWSQDYKKEKVEELKELVSKLEKADATELTELVPKAIVTLVKLYDWSLGGEEDDYQILSELIAEVAKKHLELDQDDIENLIEELEHKLK